MTKISVLMPVYNAEDYLAEAIDSVLAQTFADWELIIGDDGSTDGTENIVRSYSDFRISYYKNEENKGHTYTKYTLLDKSKGEYIAFLDADDVSLPERLSIQVDFMNRNPEYGLCGTWGIMIDPEGNKIKKMTYVAGDKYIKCALVFNTAFLQSSIMVKRELMQELYYDKEIPLVEDFNFECLVSRKCKVENIKKELIKYRWHNSNISNTKADILKNLNEKIYQRELQVLDIHPNDRELNIHNAIRDINTQGEITDNIFFGEAKNWLKKLANANKKTLVYDSDIFRATICLRWIYACKERKAYSKICAFPIRLNINAFCKLFQMIYIRL